MKENASVEFCYNHCMLIRNYTTRDYSAVQNLLKQADMYDNNWDSEENFSSMIKFNPQSIQVAEIEEKIAGVIVIESHGKQTAFFYRLVVDEQKQKSGIGSALLQKAETLVRVTGAKEAALYVESENTKLKEYYTNRGYKSSEKTYFCMWKPLD